MSFPKLNSVNIVGNIADDLGDRLRKVTTDRGEQSVITFPIAVDGANGDKEKPGYFDVTCWGKGAEALVEYQSKGSLVAVSGSLRQRSFPSKKHEGETEYRIEIANATVYFLGSGNGGSSAPSAEQLAAVEANKPTSDDDIPF